MTVITGIYCVDDHNYCVTPKGNLGPKCDEAQSYIQYSQIKDECSHVNKSSTTCWMSCYKKLMPEQIQFVTLHSFWSSLTELVSTTRVQNSVIQEQRASIEPVNLRCSIKFLSRISGSSTCKAAIVARLSWVLDSSIPIRCCYLYGETMSKGKKSAYPLDSLPKQLAIENMLTKTALEMCVCPSKATVCIQFLLSRCSLF